VHATASSTQPSGLSDLARDLAAVIHYIQKASGRSFLGAVGELDLSLTQLKAMAFLERVEREVSVKDLAGELGLSLPAASRSIDGLHGRGLLERREDEDDRRMKRVQLTPEGSRTVRRLNDIRISGLEDFLTTFSAAERRRFAAALAPFLAREEVGACRLDEARDD